MVRGADGTLTEASWTLALQAAADGLRKIVDTSGPGAVAVLGGARLANEDAYAWARLAKSVLGTDNVDCQLGDGLPAEVVLGLPQATIDEACAAPAILLLGPDLKEELPVLYLRLREAIVDKGVPLVELVPAATGLTRHAAVSLLHRPGEAAAVARALAGAIAGARVSSEGAGGVSGADHRAGGRGPRARTGVVVVLGRPSLAEPASATVDAAGVLAQGLPGVRFLPVLRRANVRGALDMGLAPGLLPGRVSLDDGRRGSPTPRRGDRCPRPAASTPPASSRPRSTTTSTPWSCWAPTPCPTSPTGAWPGGPSTRSPSPWPSTPSPTRRCGAPTWSCPRPASPSARAPPPTSRAGSPAWARRSPPPARPGPTG